MGEYLWPSDFIRELEAILSGMLVCRDFPNHHIVLSGILPDSGGLLEILDKHGVEIIGEDLLSCSRRFLSRPRYEINDPFPSLCEDFFSLPPCSTKNSSIAERIEYISSFFKIRLDRCVIFNVIKFCEPELFDLPNLRAGLNERMIDSLVLETEVNEPLSGALTTRVEAFLEMTGGWL